MQHDHPCRPDCPERSATCHTTCERYLARYAANRAASKARAAAQKKESELNDYTVQQCRKNQKKKPSWHRKQRKA